MFPTTPLLSNSSPIEKERTENQNELRASEGPTVIARDYTTNNVVNEQQVPEFDYLPRTNTEDGHFSDGLLFDDDALNIPSETIGISVDAEAEFHPTPEGVTTAATDVIPDLHKTRTFALSSSSIIALTLVS